MKIFLLLLVLILMRSTSLNAQLAVIRDPDGFTNVRSAASAEAKIIGKFHDGDVFYYENQENGWVKVGYYPADSSDKKYLEGYIHKDRLMPLGNLPQIPDRARKITTGHLIYHYDSLTFELFVSPFRAKHHALRKDEGRMIQKIDGKRPLGTDGEMPLEKLTGMRMVIAGDSVEIPPAAWDNLYDPTLHTCNIYFNKKTGFLYIDLQNWRSAAGGYELVWIFKDGKYIKRYVDQSNN